MTEVSSPAILVVDDNEAHNYSVSRRLRQIGWNVTSVSTGESALEAVHQLPDVVLLDVNLPDIPGHQVCRKISSDPRTAHIPVVLFSAEEGGELAQAMAKSVGAVGLLSSPLPTEPLVLALKKAIDE